MLREFDLVFGLSVNFNKRRIIEFNVNQFFSRGASNFLDRAISSILLTFLGISIGCNLRKRTLYDPFLYTLMSRLVSWKRKFVSLGGRVILLS